MLFLVKNHMKRQIKFTRLFPQHGKLIMDYGSLLSLEIESLLYPVGNYLQTWVSPCQDTALFGHYLSLFFFLF